MNNTSQRMMNTLILEKGYTAGVMFKLDLEDEQDFALPENSIHSPLSMEMLQSCNSPICFPRIRSP